MPAPQIRPLRFAKRLATCVALSAALIAITYWRADARSRPRLDAARAIGLRNISAWTTGPPSIPVPPDENQAIAFNSIRWDPKNLGPSMRPIPNEDVLAPSHSAEWWEYAERSARANAPAFQAFIDASGRPHWYVPSGGRFTASSLYFSTLADEVVRRHLRGDHRAAADLLLAIESWRAGLLTTHDPAAIDYALNDEEAFVELASLQQVGTGPHDVPPALARRLAAALCADDLPARREMLAAYLTSKAGTMTPRPSLLRPVVLHAQAIQWESLATDVSVVQATSPAQSPDLVPGIPASRYFEDGSLWRERSAELSRRFMAIDLAIRSYRATHADAWPATLGDLVPAELPALPPDPFSPDARPPGYLASERRHVLTTARTPAATFDLARMPLSYILHLRATSHNYRDLDAPDLSATARATSPEGTPGTTPP